MLVSCPHCQTDLNVAPELYGQTVQCPACQGRLEVPKIDAAAENEAARHPERGAGRRRTTPTSISSKAC